MFSKSESRADPNDHGLDQEATTGLMHFPENHLAVRVHLQKLVLFVSHAIMDAMSVTNYLMPELARLLNSLRDSDRGAIQLEEVRLGPPLPLPHRMYGGRQPCVGPHVGSGSYVCCCQSGQRQPCRSLSCAVDDVLPTLPPSQPPGHLPTLALVWNQISHL